MKDYYYILGIESDASEDEIKKAYRKLSVKFHPDKNEGDKFFENRFKEIQEAYETLSNKNQRILYDSALKI
ncbi:MAG: DnaJ domain-containing protein [Saprospiraceae bacterium]|nr:DnaJ domain-containing protein [Saprospiraceae bacterium]